MVVLDVLYVDGMLCVDVLLICYLFVFDVVVVGGCVVGMNV